MSDIIETQSVKIHTKEPSETQNNYDHYENEEIPLPDEPPIVQKNDESIKAYQQTSL